MAATPPQGIDRDADADAAWQAYKEREWRGWDSLQPDLHEAFLAGWVARPVRPVEGVVLTRDERKKLAYLVEHASYSSTLDIFVIEWLEEHGAALAARLDR